MRRALAAILLLLAAPAAAEEKSFGNIERGRYLTTVGDCVACHTVPGGTPFAGGRPVETPFGTLVTPNLTPDRETGLGDWSDDEFVRAVTQGIGRNGRHLYPALPYVYYTKATRDDVLAIRTYLSVLQPVRNPVVSNQLPFPFDIRASLIAWNAMFFTPGEFRPTPQKSSEWNRGAYLVESLGHCGACHTAKNLLGGDKTSAAYQGGVLQGWYSPNLSGDGRTGLGGWSVDDVVEYLKTGHNRAAASSGPMMEVVSYSTSHMEDGDLKAIAVYLKDLPGQDRTAAPAATDAATRAGQVIYVDNCSACHTASGAGIPRLFPALAKAPSIQSDDPTSLIRVVLQGAQSVATDGAPTGPAMPALGWKLSDEEVAAVVTYIRTAWGNAASTVAAGDVRRLREQLAQRTD